MLTKLYIHRALKLICCQRDFQLHSLQVCGQGCYLFLGEGGYGSILIQKIVKKKNNLAKTIPLF